MRISVWSSDVCSSDLFRSVLIDPYTGKVRGQKSSFGLASFLRIFHKQLYIVPVDLLVHGTWIVGALGVALLSSALAGLLSMRRWWRALVTLRRGDRKSTRLHSSHYCADRMPSSA